MKNTYPLFKTFFLLMFVVLLSGCADIYTNPGFSKVKSQHKTVAILPFNVVIQTKRLPKGMTPEMIEAQQKNEALVVQSTCYSIFLKKMKNYSVTFQDTDKTNALLAREGITPENIHTVSKDVIAQILGVDAVISGKILRDQPISEGGALALGLLVGVSAPTNTVVVDFTIHERTGGELMWKFNHKVQGGLGSSSQGLAESLMKQISRKFPYSTRG